MDKLSKEQRSAVMRSVGSKNTTPEKLVRSIAHQLGYRFRLHRKDLPGTPDIVFPSQKKVIFVHGCFWHDHSCAKGRKKPQTNASYWKTKISNNRKRDAKDIATLKKMGWSVLVIWECETKDHSVLTERIFSFIH